MNFGSYIRWSPVARKVVSPARLTDNGFDAPGVTMAKFCGLVSTSVPLGRPVVDKIGIAGVFNIHLDLSAAELGYPVPGPRTDPSSIFTALNAALQKIGLKLESSNGSAEVIVIDSVERPR